MKKSAGLPGLRWVAANLAALYESSSRVHLRQQPSLSLMGRRLVMQMHPGMLGMCLRTLAVVVEVFAIKVKLLKECRQCKINASHTGP